MRGGMRSPECFLVIMLSNDEQDNKRRRKMRGGIHAGRGTNRGNGGAKLLVNDYVNTELQNLPAVG